MGPHGNHDREFSVEDPRGPRRAGLLPAAVRAGAAALLVLALTLLSTCRPAPAPPVSERLAGHAYPRLFLQLQDYAPSTSLLEQAAYWDIVIVDAETVESRPEWLGPGGRLRARNPGLVLLAYFSAADVIPGNAAPVNGGFLAGLDESWFVRDVAGDHYRLFWLGDQWSLMLNPTTPVASYMPEYLSERVLATGLVDGIFYDWVSDSVSWLNHRLDNPNRPIDLDGDGRAESDEEVDQLWVAGMTDLLKNSRAVFPPGSLVVGNGGWFFDDRYADVLNGRMVEGFLEGEEYGLDWFVVMQGHYLMERVSVEPKVSLVMANGVEDDFARMRFALASVLMFDGYFCYTNSNVGPAPYLSTWWYDEYAVDLTTGRAVKDLAARGYLGWPVSEARNVADPAETLGEMLATGDRRVSREVWRRDFEHGIVLVNPSREPVEVDLGGEYRKITGQYDPAFNNGEVLTAITLEPRSGAVLLRVPDGP